jgi:hypothetical protein
VTKNVIALGHVLILLFIASWLAGFVAIILVFFFSIRMIFQFKNLRDSFSQKTLWNPMNAIVNPGLLSEKGMASRRYALKALVAFFVSLGLGFTSIGLLRLLSIFAKT